MTKLRKLSYIQESLYCMRDRDNADFGYSLGMGTGYPYLGVRMPQLRNLGKEVAQQDNWREVLDNPEILSYKTFEEVLLHALIIGYAKMDIDERLERLEAYIPYINDWALCDGAVSTLRFKPEEYDKVWNFAAKLLRSHEEFRVRFGAVLLLFRLKDRMRLDEHIDALAAADTSAYYAMMAVAWACAELFKLNNDRVFYFLTERRLDRCTTRKALTKICESRTTSNAYREMIRAYRAMI